jgi:hypothetical protein
MQAKVFLTSFILIGMFLLVAGCTQTTIPPPTTTTTPTTVHTTAAPPTMQPTTPATVTTTPALDSIEGPLPSQYMVDVQVDRNTVSTAPTITVTFRGGKGINFVSSMDVVLTRSDGQVAKETILKPRVNSQVTMDGTRGTDRVQVFVTMVDGNRYRVYDQELAFRSYY